eukprot:CAMPEP_0182421794 /NCGR_PEP_ID=MMETSP1167-20130531/7292_1 /TAXON_ID=2988 /ORGANISM="Mallomonas Sp, Strain CCMP3275" /LENGTH=976 /DNA_ID=CAMNT_0024599279 /DNA_START=206 /DNA_END=3136 /DNA_ORIENTATION=-
MEPTLDVTPEPSQEPSLQPTIEPTLEISETREPTLESGLTIEPTLEITETLEPTLEPTAFLTFEPSAEPSTEPSPEPSVEPTPELSSEPTMEDTSIPSAEPSKEPTSDPTFEATSEPTAEPMLEVTEIETRSPTLIPLSVPSMRPISPTFYPSTEDRDSPSSLPSQSPHPPTVEPTQGVDKEDRCFRIVAYDSFGDGWDSAKLFLFDSMDRYTSYAPNTTENHIAIQYCFPIVPMESDFVVATVIGYQSHFPWEIQWQVLLPSGATYRGAYDTYMTFVFNYNYNNATNLNDPKITLLQANNLVDDFGGNCTKEYMHQCSLGADGDFLYDDEVEEDSGSNDGSSARNGTVKASRPKVSGKVNVGGDSQAGSEALKKALGDAQAKRTARPTVQRTSRPSRAPIKPTNSPKRSGHGSPPPPKTDPKPPPKAPPKVAPKAAPKQPLSPTREYRDRSTPSTWGTLGINGMNDDSNATAKNAIKDRSSFTKPEDWGELDWADVGKTAPSAPSQSTGTRVAGTKAPTRSIKGDEWGELEWDIGPKGASKSNSEPTMEPTSAAKSSISSSASTSKASKLSGAGSGSYEIKSKLVPSVSSGDENVTGSDKKSSSSKDEATVDSSVMVRLYADDSSWFDVDGLTVMYTVSDVNGTMRFDWGTLCPGGILANGGARSDENCVAQLEDGPYIMRVTGAMVPNSENIRWEFCGSSGGAMTEVLFMMTNGVCRMLRVRPAETVACLGDQKYENDEIIIRANVVYGSSYTHNDYYGTSRFNSKLIRSDDDKTRFLSEEDVTEAVNAEREVMIGVMSEELQNTISFKHSLHESVSVASWEVKHNEDGFGSMEAESSEDLTRHIGFHIKLNPHMFGVDASSTSELKSFGVSLKDHISKTMKTGLFLAHMKSEAVKSQSASLRAVNFVKLTSLEVSHNVRVNEEVSLLASVVVIIGGVTVVGVLSLLFFRLVKSRTETSYTKLPLDSQDNSVFL